MARRTPHDRLEKLLDVAASAFVEHGYQRTQMDDIAAALCVSKGTVYRSVDSKESLLAAVLTHADSADGLPADGPLPTIGLEDVSATVRDEVAIAITGLELTAAIANPPTATTPAAAIADEVERVTLDLYEVIARNRIRVMVLDRCAAELPVLAGDWFESGRYAIVDLWREYLAQRTTQLSSTVDVDVLARTIVELVTLWAVKMPWDPAPRPYQPDTAAACAAMIRDLLTGTER